MNGATASSEGPFFDFQVNGFAGVDFQQPGLSVDAMARAAAALRSRGIVRIFVTLISDTIDALEAKLANLERIRGESPAVAEVVAGYHIEGPYLSPEDGYRGAHPAAVIKAPDVGEFERLWRASHGNIRLVTLAPEWPGSPAFIRVLVARGVSVALGHTNASHAEIGAAIAAGARFVTHLGNGVPQVLHRHDNVVQRLLARDALTACLIPDGIHLPPAVLKNFYRAKPPGKVLFTADCMAAAGAPPGRYTLGGLELEAGADGVVRLPGTGLFAGSSLSIDDAPANLERWLGIRASEARCLCGQAAARAFGIELPAHPIPQST